MRLRKRKKKADGTCGEGNLCVQLHSHRASLVNEFCIDKREHNLSDLDAAEEFLRQTLAPCDFASTTVTLISDDGTGEQEVLQFELNDALPSPAEQQE